MGWLDHITVLFGPVKPGRERREMIRLKCRFPVRCFYKDQSFRGIVTDMGIKGLRLESPRKLRKGQMLQIELEELTGPFSVARVNCQVRWCRNQKTSTFIGMGVSYEEPLERMSDSWVRSVLYELGFEEEFIYQRRRAVRVDCCLSGELEMDGQRVPVSIVNLGVGGALIRGMGALELRDPVRLFLGPETPLPSVGLESEVVGMKAEAGEQHLLSVRFLEMSPSLNRTLGRYVMTQLREQ